MDVLFVNISGDLPDEPFLANRSINEEKIPGRDKPYYFGVEKEPYEFDVNFYCENWTDEKIQEIQSWLSEPTDYAPFFSTDNLDRIFYCLYTGEVKFNYNGERQGVVSFKMRCDSPYTYSRVYRLEYDFSTKTENTIIEFNNLGQMILKPEFEVKMFSSANGILSITNLTNAGEELRFEDLETGEILYVDNEHEQILSDIPTTPTTNRYNNHNGIFLELVSGINRLQISGGIKIVFRYQYAFY